MMIFALFRPNLSKGRHDQIYAIRFISVIQACLTMTAKFVLISWFSRSDEFMKPLSTILSLGASSQYGYIVVVTNQSAAKFLSTNQNRAFGPCDLCDVTMPIFGHGFTRDPME